MTIRSTLRPAARGRLQALACAFALVLPWPVQALAEPFAPQFPFPVIGATALPAAYDSYLLPLAPWRDGALATEAFEGQVDRRAWQLDSGRASLLEMLAPLRDQLLALGYEVVLDCEARACGGFDFRFATEVLPEPGMHVDLNEFRFVSARRGTEAVGLMVSRSASAGFVQIITVGAEALPAPVPGAVPSEESAAPDTTTIAPLTKPVPESVPQGDGLALLGAGLPFALDDLVFETGSASLSHRDYGSLALLAEWMQEDSARRIILVGHTDLSGSLDANIALSKRRAEAVRAALISDFAIPGARISAEGAGPLAPRASNATEEGRQKNRRVEAIPAPT